MKSVLFIDSGIGGLSTLAQTCKLVPNLNFIYFADDKYAPYGTKSKSFLHKRLLEIIDLFAEQIDLVVLACNTATTNAIDYLRTCSNKTIIGTEPAIKPAAEVSKNVLLVATPRTVKSKRIFALSHKYHINLKTLALPDLAKHIDSYYLHQNHSSLCKINKTIKQITNKAQNCGNIVLGCTHYCFIKDKLASLTKLPIIDGNFGVAKQVAQHIKLSNWQTGQKQFIVSSGNAHLQKKYAKIFKTLANYNDV